MQANRNFYSFVAQRELLGRPGCCPTAGLLNHFNSSGGTIAVAPGPETVVPFALSYSKVLRNSKLLAIADEAGWVSIIDTNKPTLPKSLHWDTEHPPAAKWPAHANTVYDIAWGKNDTVLFTACGDWSVGVWDTTTARKLHSCEGHNGSVKAVRPHSSHPDIFASGGRDGCVLLWDLRTPTQWKPEQQRMCLVPALKLQGAPNTNCRSVTSLVFMNDGHSLTTAGDLDGTIQMWDMRCLAMPYTKVTTPQTASKGRTTPRKGSSKGQQQQHGLEPWFNLTCPRSTSRPHGITSLALAPHGNLLLVSTSDSAHYLYSTSALDSAPVARYTGHRADTFCVKSGFSPDGKHIVSGSSDGLVYIWNVDDVPDAPPLTLHGHTAEVTAVSWCPSDVLQLATAGDDCTVRVWNVVDRDSTQPHSSQQQMCRPVRSSSNLLHAPRAVDTAAATTSIPSGPLSVHGAADQAGRSAPAAAAGCRITSPVTPLPTAQATPLMTPTTQPSNRPQPPEQMISPAGPVSLQCSGGGTAARTRRQLSNTLASPLPPLHPTTPRLRQSLITDTPQLISPRPAAAGHVKARVACNTSSCQRQGSVVASMLAADMQQVTVHNTAAALEAAAAEARCQPSSATGMLTIIHSSSVTVLPAESAPAASASQSRDLGVSAHSSPSGAGTAAVPHTGKNMKAASAAASRSHTPHASLEAAPASCCMLTPIKAQQPSATLPPHALTSACVHNPAAVESVAAEQCFASPLTCRHPTSAGPNIITDQFSAWMSQLTPSPPDSAAGHGNYDQRPVLHRTHQQRPVPCLHAAGCSCYRCLHDDFEVFCDPTTDEAVPGTYCYDEHIQGQRTADTLGDDHTMQCHDIAAKEQVHNVAPTVCNDDLSPAVCYVVPATQISQEPAMPEQQQQQGTVVLLDSKQYSQQPQRQPAGNALQVLEASQISYQLQAQRQNQECADQQQWTLLLDRNVAGSGGMLVIPATQLTTASQERVEGATMQEHCTHSNISLPCCLLVAATPTSQPECSTGQAGTAAAAAAAAEYSNSQAGMSPRKPGACMGAARSPFADLGHLLGLASRHNVSDAPCLPINHAGSGSTVVGPIISNQHAAGCAAAVSSAAKQEQFHLFGSPHKHRKRLPGASPLGGPSPKAVRRSLQQQDGCRHNHGSSITQQHTTTSRGMQPHRATAGRQNAVGVAHWLVHQSIDDSEHNDGSNAAVLHAKTQRTLSDLWVAPAGVDECSRFSGC
eukprot:jgi/Chrzof1/8160/UNPLg00207.t1